jgi:hypothetical protein
MHIRSLLRGWAVARHTGNINGGLRDVKAQFPAFWDYALVPNPDATFTIKWGDENKVFRVADIPFADSKPMDNKELREVLEQVLRQLISKKKPSLLNLVACIQWVHRVGEPGKLRDILESGQVPPAWTEVS